MATYTEEGFNSPSVISLIRWQVFSKLNVIVNDIKQHIRFDIRPIAYILFDAWVYGCTKRLPTCRTLAALKWNYLSDNIYFDIQNLPAIVLLRRNLNHCRLSAGRAYLTWYYRRIDRLCICRLVC